MIDISEYQMAIRFCSFLKHPAVTISLSLFVLMISSAYLYIQFSTYSAYLTLVVLVLPTSFSFIFSKFKSLYVCLESTQGGKMVNELASEDEQIQQRARPSLQNDHELFLSEVSFQSSDSLGYSADNGASTEDTSGCSEESVSDEDDESLIEIAIPKIGHYVEEPDDQEEEIKEAKPIFMSNLSKLLLDFRPDDSFRKNALIEFLPEITEEENMIEIDITMGSIKCSNLQVEA